MHVRIFETRENLPYELMPAEILGNHAQVYGAQRSRVDFSAQMRVWIRVSADDGGCAHDHDARRGCGSENVDI